MTFLLPYFLFCPSDRLDRHHRRDGAWPFHPLRPHRRVRAGGALRGRRSTGEAVGYIPVLGSLALAIGYSCVVGWIFKYFALALDGGLFAMGQNMNVIVDSFNGTACGWGNNFWLVIALAVNFAIMAFGVGGGIERANKVMMPVLFFLFAGLGVYIATLPGRATATATSLPSTPWALPTRSCGSTPSGRRSFALRGRKRHGDLRILLLDDESDPSAARNVALFDTIAALLAAFVIIPAMAAGGAPFRRRPG